MGLYSNAYQVAMICYCKCYSRMVEMDRILTNCGDMTYDVVDKLGHIVKMYKRPEVSILENAEREMRRWVSELGLTPSASAGIPKQNDGKKDINGFGEFLE